MVTNATGIGVEGNSGFSAIKSIAAGVLGSSTAGPGVFGSTSRTFGTSAAGVEGFHPSGTGVFGHSPDGFGVMGFGGGTFSAGVVGQSDMGVGVIALGGTGVGVFAAGEQAQLQLSPGVFPGAPTSGNHERGELWLDSNGDLFLCKAGGTPGTWKLIA